MVTVYANLAFHIILQGQRVASLEGWIVGGYVRSHRIRPLVRGHRAL